jgi:exoribonuclease R
MLHGLYDLIYLCLYSIDERISMFPEDLSSTVLSLGATIDSYALSCGVILAANGSIESFEVCPSRIRITKKLTYTQLDDILNKDVKNLGLLAFDKEDLTVLNTWAVKRHQYRIAQGALDVYMRDKTELSLSIKKDTKNTGKVYVSGYTIWTNGTSSSLVSEYMILMSQTIGEYCASKQIPVLFKTQIPSTPIRDEDIELQEGETPFMRATRLILTIRPAIDAPEPGLHCSSGSDAYVQCTSPIRRYHDLYNHYRLKASMHAHSMGDEYAFRAEEEAGITSLDLMSSATIRQETLNAIKMVTRARENYWLGEYMEKLICSNSRQTFDCMIFGSHFEDASLRSSESIDHASLYDALILPLGSFTRYLLYSPASVLKRGDVVQCNLYRRKGVPQTPYFLVPTDIELKNLPKDLRLQLTQKFTPEPTETESVDQVFSQE